jgi:hypothetical protein
LEQSLEVDGQTRRSERERRQATTAEAREGNGLGDEVRLTARGRL